MKQWYKIVDYPLRSSRKVLEFPTREGDFCSTAFTSDMEALVKDLPDSEVSPFSTEDFRRLYGYRC